VSAVGEVGYIAAFLGGLLALLSPCGALLLPAFFSYAFERRSQMLARTGIFYLGLLTTLVPLGVSASAATVFVRSHQQTVITVAGVAVVVLGIVTAFGGGFVLFRRSDEAAVAQTNPMSIYTLGLAYGLTGFCTGPILGSILVLAAAGGQPVRGGLLLAVYGLGMVVPLAVLALTWGSIGQRVNRWLRGRTVQVGRLTFHSTSLISGLVLVAVGAFMIVNGGNLVESNTLALAGARAEEWATNLGSRVPDSLLAIVAFLAAGAWLTAAWRRDQDPGTEAAPDHVDTPPKPISIDNPERPVDP
jgi:cytochrome c biogenesis protein CcdA